MRTLTSRTVEVGLSVALSAIMACPVLAGVVSQTGNLVSAQNKSLTMILDEDGSTHSYEVAPSATITRNGRTVTLEDLMPGDNLRVTLDSNQSITSCDATSAMARFSQSHCP
ncbi:MAG TPA: hypothetical protein VHV77_08595 [Pirellulales bacterium]|nr:hypothetical protein [Pirellulales bacterium]